MKWFRFYAEAMHDPKVQRLPAETFKCWVNLLCVASDHKARGELPAVSDIAFILRLSDAKAGAFVSALVSAGLIDVGRDGTLRPHNWEARQPKSDNVAERVNKYRMKQNEAVPATLPVTLQHRNRNGPDSEGEGDTDSDSEGEGGVPPPPAPDGAKPKPSPNTPAETEDAVERVAAMFDGTTNVPQEARLLCRDAKAAWVVEAARSMHDSGKADPRYLRKIVERFKSQGGSDSEKAPARASPRPGAASYTPPKLTDEQKAHFRSKYAK